MTVRPRHYDVRRLPWNTIHPALQRDRDGQRYVALIDDNGQWTEEPWTGPGDAA